MDREAGFTWIEMMMVIGVLAVLALMAVPGARDSALKKQVKDGLALADVAKQGVQVVWSLTHEMPADNKAAAVPDAQKIVGNVVKAVDVRDGAVTITFGNNASKALEDKKLTLRPAVVPDEPAVPIAWLCNEAKAPQSMQVKGRNDTDVPSGWLPAECR